MATDPIVRSLRRLGMLLLMVAVVEYLVLPQVAGARRSVHLLGQVNVAYVVAGVILEALAIAAYARLTTAVLPQVGAPPYWTVLRIDMSTLAVSHIVPGGTAAGASLGYRLLTTSGVSGTDTTFALAAQGAGSAIVLNVLLWLGLLVSIPFRGFDPLYGTAAIIGALLLGAFALAVFFLVRGEDRVARLVCSVADRVPFLDGPTISDSLRHVANRLRALAADRSLLARAIGWAAVNWLLDAASLWVFVAAFGFKLPVVGLIVSFGLANVLAAIPITPGGLGVVEAVLTSTMVGFGAPRGVAVLGVISYRLVNFWLPIPLGGLAYLSLKVGPGATTEAKAEELRREAVSALDESPDPREWAREHGFKLPKD